MVCSAEPQVHQNRASNFRGPLSSVYNSLVFTSYIPMYLPKPLEERRLYHSYDNQGVCLHHLITIHIAVVIRLPRTGPPSSSLGIQWPDLRSSRLR
jgi:hypothetical protein